MIRLSEPTLLGNELQYLEECIHSGWVSAEGGFVRKLEEELASYHGRGMLATATSSGTAALQLALLTMGLRPGELVLVPALSFLATINPVIHMGGEPLVLDVEPDCLGLSPEVLLDYIRVIQFSEAGPSLTALPAVVFSALLPCMSMASPVVSKSCAVSRRTMALC